MDSTERTVAFPLALATKRSLSLAEGVFFLPLLFDSDTISPSARFQETRVLERSSDRTSKQDILGCPVSIKGEFLRDTSLEASVRPPASRGKARKGDTDEVTDGASEAACRDGTSRRCDVRTRLPLHPGVVAPRPETEPEMHSVRIGRRGSGKSRGTAQMQPAPGDAGPVAGHGARRPHVPRVPTC